MVGRASELARLLSHVDRAASGRARRSCSPVTPGSARPGCSTSSPGAAAAAGSACSPGTASTSATSACPTCCSSTCCARSPPIPELAAAAGNPVAGLLAGRPAAPVPRRDGDLGRPLPNRAALQLVDDGGCSCSSRWRRCSASWPRPPAADRAGGRALGRPVQPRPAPLPAGPAGRRTGRRRGVLPLRRSAPAASAAAAAARRAGPPPGRRAAGARAAAGRGGREPRPRARRRRGWGVPEETVEDVVARAEGNAFYAEELFAAGRRGQALPPALTDVLLARVEQRSDAAQQVLRIAAVAGRRVRHELVAAVGGLPGRARGGPGRDGAQPPAGGLRRRPLPVPARAAAGGGARRPAAGERVRLHASIAAYLTATPERRHGGRARAPRPGEQRPARCAGRLAGGGSTRPADRRPRRAAPAPGDRARPLVGGARRGWPTGRDQPRLLREAAATARTAGSCTAPSPCSARP